MSEIESEVSSSILEAAAIRIFVMSWPGVRLNNRLAALWKIVESGDGKPTEGSYQVTKELTAELEINEQRNSYLSVRNII